LFGASAKVEYAGAGPTLFEVRVNSDGAISVGDLAGKALV
jgi:hypothetical protein